MQQETTHEDGAETNELVSTEAENALESATEQEQAESAPEEADEEQAAEPESAKTPDGVQQRINEITRKRREAERRAERAEKRARELEARNLDDLDYEEQIAERTLNRSRREQIENDRETANELALEAYQARVEAATVKYPDYAQVANNPSLAITPAMAEAILDSDCGPDIAYHLGKNPAEAARISQLNPPSQARELGKIEALVSAPRQAANPAPTPVKRVGAGGSGGVSKDPAKMTMAEYAAWRKANP